MLRTRLFFPALGASHVIHTRRAHMCSCGAPSDTPTTKLNHLHRPDAKTILKETPPVDASLSSMENTLGIDEAQFERMKTLASGLADRVVTTSREPLFPHGCGTDYLLTYNRLWAESIKARDPTYFARQAEQQTPDYFYIGCSDSRVVANEIMGLAPGEVFVHRNVANIVSPSDLNMLSALQFSVDHLRVEDVIVSGHYGCGGVTAVFKGTVLGLADHWVSHVLDVKNRHWPRMTKEIPPNFLLDALCELNVVAQVAHLVNSHIVHDRWMQQNLHDENPKEHPDSPINTHDVRIHGWIYGLEDGLIRSLITLGKESDCATELQAAEEAIFRKYAKMKREQ